MFADNEYISISIRRVKNGFIVQVPNDETDEYYASVEFVFPTMKEVLEFLEARYVPTEA